jgi:hypothetical protein
MNAAFQRECQLKLVTNNNSINFTGQLCLSIFCGCCLHAEPQTFALQARTCSVLTGQQTQAPLGTAHVPAVPVAAFCSIRRLARCIMY